MPVVPVRGIGFSQSFRPGGYCIVNSGLGRILRRLNCRRGLVHGSDEEAGSESIEEA